MLPDISAVERHILRKEQYLFWRSEYCEDALVCGSILDKDVCCAIRRGARKYLLVFVTQSVPEMLARRAWGRVLRAVKVRDPRKAGLIDLYVG